MGCTYSPMDYADPDAVTQIANGISTTTYAYDNNGNLISAGTGAATTTYTYDYANGLTALFAGGATTSYSYDAFGTRVLQTGTTTTYIYPFKWYSIASSTGSGAKYATTTDYVFNGDTLLSTVDQQTASGVATGTAKTRYIHPDHLGSTNVVTDENDAVVQTLDYYPYGSLRISSGTSTNERRKFIGQFVDDSNLSYLNARYYEGSRGQFLSEDPTYLNIGKDPSANRVLKDPQAMNGYSYGSGNPITNKDPDGREAYGLNFNLGAEGGFGLFATGFMSGGIYYVRNPDTGQRWLAFPISFAANSGALGAYQSYPGVTDPHQLPVVFGAYGGAGISGSYGPNARSPDDLRGVQNSLNINLPLISGSIQGAGTRSPIYTLGTGAKDFGSMSMYPVQTWVPASINLNQYGSGARGASQQNQQSSQQSSSGGGGSSVSLISLYQSLVSTLSALVSALSGGKR